MSVYKLAPPDTDKFLAGILNHMGALCSFSMANFDGYARTAKDAAGAWIGYGIENRDLPVRKVSDQNWEFRMMDGTANPYLFTAAVLLAGSNGVGEKAVLAWEDCRVFPHSLDGGGRAEDGLDKTMPSSLQEALESLEEDVDFHTLIPEGLLYSYIPIKEKGVEVLQNMTEEQRRLKFLEYF